MKNARITERALRLIWQTQLVSPRDLITTDRRQIVVFSPGSANPDSGPDFLDALLQIGKIVYRGDVEIHCDSGSWFRHGHHRSPAYNSVVLHVAGRDAGRPAVTLARRILPLLILPPPGSAPTESSPGSPFVHNRTDHSIHISCPFKCPAAGILDVLGHLADRRLECRIRQFNERLHQLINERRGILREAARIYGGDQATIPDVPVRFARADYTSRAPWEQLLYEALMESCGFEKNQTPFLRLARSVPVEFLQTRDVNDTRMMMAILFGYAGLLPSIHRIKGKESRAYVLDLKRTWKNLTGERVTPMLQEWSWLFFRLRPSNFPTARLAAMCFLLPRFFDTRSFSQIIEIFRSADSPPLTRIRRLRALFAFEPDTFWKHHLHFFRGSMRGGICIGTARTGDIIINTIVPFILLYARIFGDAPLRLRAYEAFRRHPPLQRNAITRCIQKEVLRDAVSLRSARLQQGAIQLYKTYCVQNRCADCGVGKIRG